MKLYSIETGNLKLDGGAMFGVVPKVMWSKKYPADENNLINLAMRCLLVIDGDRKILIDNGIGDKQDEKFLKHFHLNGEETLKSSLAKLGLSKDDITDMVLTHLHFDHTGGSIEWNEDKTKLIPAFKNANYWVSKAQWEWATKPNKREKASFLGENIQPMEESGQLKIIEEEGELFPNFNVKLYNGHTDGQVIPHINYNGRTVVFMADLLPSTAHIPMPWVMAYDTRPLLTLQEKEQFYEEAIENDYVLFFEHDIYNECCTLEATERGPKVKETFKLNELLE
ncbi:MBL fold metallo-hydrolase [Lentimicrobium sp. L6]|uniref:MBL fold metallo-hydrolase n=1 Tax=Lentimicrobium sp. L6 TaxID=2735916 RepID=UPI00155711D1|nr:MBL fold metallo-hydrolase [Lentimicrobium sp. L6]NPD83911.1 MBL fold metallo-hydrolase [Lentimicrobium sp. L6]